MSTNRSRTQRQPSPARAGSSRAGASRPGGAARAGSSQARATRQTVEQRSATPLLYLRGLPRWLPPVVLAALLVAGLAARGWAGAAALCLVAGFLGWLAFLSWPRATAGGRAGRLAAVACVLALAAYQATR